MTAATEKHTPGPWTAKMSKYNEDTLVVQAGMPSNRVLARFGSEAEPLDDTDRANARLIAAAPDLLEALNGILTANADGKDVSKYLDAVEVARATIAKATA